MPREKSPTTPSAGKSTPRKTLTRKKLDSPVASFVGPERRAALIAEAAYYHAERRGFAPGHEMEDWLAAEVEVDAKLLRSAPGQDTLPPS